MIAHRLWALLDSDRDREKRPARDHDARPDAANQVVGQEALRAPREREGRAEHPEREEVHRDVAERSVQPHVREWLPEIALVPDHDRSHREDRREAGAQLLGDEDHEVGDQQLLDHVRCDRRAESHPRLAIAASVHAGLSPLPHVGPLPKNGRLAEAGSLAGRFAFGVSGRSGLEPIRSGGKGAKFPRSP